MVVLPSHGFHASAPAGGCISPFYLLFYTVCMDSLWDTCRQAHTDLCKLFQMPQGQELLGWDREPTRQLAATQSFSARGEEVHMYVSLSCTDFLYT